MPKASIGDYIRKDGRVLQIQQMDWPAQTYQTTDGETLSFAEVSTFDLLSEEETDEQRRLTIPFSVFRDDMRGAVLAAIDDISRSVLQTPQPFGWLDQDLPSLFSGVDSHAQSLDKRINAGSFPNTARVRIFAQAESDAKNLMFAALSRLPESQAQQVISANQDTDHDGSGFSVASTAEISAWLETTGPKTIAH